ncbi:MAG: 4Fe-4S binding protein [Planctomycetota bacterium]
MKTAKKETSNRVKVPKGELVIMPERCKGCGICIEFCSKKALARSKEYNAKGYYFPLAANPQECSGCNMCSLLCPDFAIFMVKSKTDKNE